MAQTPSLRQIATLGEAFRAREMEEQLRQLRLYWLAVRQGLTKRNGDLDVKWSEEHLVTWMQTLQVPPYDRALAVRRKGGGCPTCGAGQGTTPSVQTVVVFPGGSRMTCRTCGLVWLETDGDVG
jgi:hypothetical protein